MGSPSLAIENRRLLIVDDMDSMRNIETSCLREAGFRHIYSEINGKKALNFLKSQPIDIVVCDWDMPELSGLEVLKEIRSDDRLKDLLFIMVTASNEAARIKEAISAGVTDYLVKPFQTDQLIYRVLKALRKLNS